MMGGLSTSSKDAAQNVALVGRIEAVPTLLRLLSEITGLRFATVARVTDLTWTACAVHDDLQFGVVPGQQLDVSTTLCAEVRASCVSVAIDHASIDPVYSTHRTPRLYNFESYVSVPIVLRDGAYFGNLCALDRLPRNVSERNVLTLFELFAQLIAVQLDNEIKQAQVTATLLDERAVSELREQFIAVLGHDLRNPLSAVDLCAQVLERQAHDPEKVVSLSKRIRTNAQRMAALIDDVLDFARGRLGGGLAVDLRPTKRLGEALEAVVAELRDGHPSRRISADIQVNADVCCDLRRLQQLASNLIANAIAHGAGDEEIRFSAVTDRQALVISVWNDGDPISPDQMTKIFSPFWRRAASAERNGLGLGLHICSEIVKAHRGELKVISSQDTGTTFVAVLPLGLAKR